MNRRNFLQSSLLASLIYGTGALPRFINEGSAAFQPLGYKKMLLNLFMSGGPDMRHIIAPEYSANASDFGYHYWRNRTRSHGIGNAPSSMRNHWNNNFDRVEHNGKVFGIAKNCGWLKKMFDDGNLAIICNAYGIDNRDHHHATLVMNQGNRTSGPEQIERSGWGGRLAVASNQNAINLTGQTNRFCYGPDGNNINTVNNNHLISINNSRNMGLREFDRTHNARIAYSTDQASRGAKSYYKTLHAELSRNSIYQRFLEHENKLREYGGLLQERLASVSLPQKIQALYDADILDGANLLKNSNFGRQIRNAYDTIASHDLLDAKVLSMSYGGWDTHESQAEAANPQFEDIFGDDKGLSALWQSLDSNSGGVNADRDNLVVLASGEFGRQLRGNGTDHGEGNIMLVFGEKVAGGVYGEMFPEGEIDRIQDASIRTPQITGLTHIDHPFAQISNWVQPGSSSSVFPDLSSAKIEQVGMFNNLFDS